MLLVSGVLPSWELQRPAGREQKQRPVGVQCSSLRCPQEKESQDQESWAESGERLVGILLLPLRIVCGENGSDCLISFPPVASCLLLEAQNGFSIVFCKETAMETIILCTSGTCRVKK